jgi:hypothetical protein
MARPMRQFRLKIAEPEENWRQRREIAYFLGFVALCARDRRHPQSPGELQGLPETLDGWRHGIASRDNRTGEPLNAADLGKILSIKASFFSALPAIRVLCERALLENEDAEAGPYFLSGIATADGLLSIARLLHYGDEGWFTCSSCGLDYHFMLFGDRIAVYGDGDDSLSDYKEGTPSGARGFMAPIWKNDVLDVRITALLSAAERAARPDLARLCPLARCSESSAIRGRPVAKPSRREGSPGPKPDIGARVAPRQVIAGTVSSKVVRPGSSSIRTNPDKRVHSRRTPVADCQMMLDMTVAELQHMEANVLASSARKA